MLSILFFILELTVVLVAAFHIYKTVKDTNRNAVGWALLTLAVGFGLQIIFPMVIVVIIAVGMMISGKMLTDIEQLPWSVNTLISLAGLAAGFVGIWLITRRVTTIPDDESFVAPPSPPTFGDE